MLVHFDTQGLSKLECLFMGHHIYPIMRKKLYSNSTIEIYNERNSWDFSRKTSDHSLSEFESYLYFQTKSHYKVIESNRGRIGLAKS